jgi:rfaE bifunctional protein nucleotidyltransferase chain/domain
MNQLQGKELSASEMAERCRAMKAEGQQIVFTNGAFDILHVGHLTYLEFARQQGDVLIVGLNSDASIQRYKGKDRPINHCSDRVRMLLGLRSVDYVVVFEEDEPLELIEQLLPDVLVKGADWAHYVSGREVVEANGGRVVLAKMVEGRSTSSLIQAIRSQS